MTASQDKIAGQSKSQLEAMGDEKSKEKIIMGQVYRASGFLLQECSVAMAQLPANHPAQDVLMKQYLSAVDVQSACSKILNADT